MVQSCICHRLMSQTDSSERAMGRMCALVGQLTQLVPTMRFVPWLHCPSSAHPMPRMDTAWCSTGVI